MTRTLGSIALFAAASLASAYVAVERRLPVPTGTLLAALLAGALLAGFAVLAGRARGSGARIAIWTLLGVSVLPALCAVAVLGSALVDDWRLSVFTRQLVSQSPPGSRVALRRARVGVLTGMGNHCDYVVEVRIEGGLREDQIVDHYESLHLQRAVAGEESSQLHMDITQDPGGGFAVMFTDAPNAPGLDWRCL